MRACRETAGSQYGAELLSYSPSLSLLRFDSLSLSRSLYSDSHARSLVLSQSRIHPLFLSRWFASSPTYSRSFSLSLSFTHMYFSLFFFPTHVPMCRALFFVSSSNNFLLYSTIFSPRHYKSLVRVRLSPWSISRARLKSEPACFFAELLRKPPARLFALSQQFFTIRADEIRRRNGKEIATRRDTRCNRSIRTRERSQALIITEPWLPTYTFYTLRARREKRANRHRVWNLFSLSARDSRNSIELIIQNYS